MTTNNTFNNQNREENNTFHKTNVAKNVAQRNSQDLEQVADTINHIADISKKLSLKYLWSKRELDGAYYIKNGNGEYEVQIFQDKRKDYRFIGSPISEFVCEVPSYEQWQQMKAFCEEFNALEVAEENQKLKELLKECRFMLREMSDVNNWLEGDDCELNYYMATECSKYVTKIDEVIK